MEIFEISKNILADNVAELKNLISPEQMYYTMKANGAESVICSLKDLDIGFELSSEGELDIIEKFQISPQRLISSLPIKSMNFIKSAYQYGIRYFTFDCLEEYEKLMKYAPAAKKILRIYIKDIDQESYAWGMTLKMLEQLVGKKSLALDQIDGIAIHISRNYQKRLLQPIFIRLKEFLTFFKKDKPMIVNIGGGYYKQLPAYLAYKYKLGQYYEELHNCLEDIRANHKVLIYCEPGRGIVDTACDLTLPVQLVSKREEKQCVFVNLNAIKLGTLPTKILRIRNGESVLIYDSDHVLEMAKQKKSYTYILMDIVSDWTEFMRIISTEPIEIGDTLKLIGVGAYSVALSSDYYSRRRICMTMKEE